MEMKMFDKMPQSTKNVDYAMLMLRTRLNDFNNLRKIFRITKILKQKNHV